MESCQFLPMCAFFNNFRGYPEVIKEGWIRMYCNDLEQSNSCARKKFLMTNGCPPPENMSPTGRFIE